MSGFGPTSSASRRQRFWYGLSLPFHLIRAIRGDPAAWRAYRRCMLAQVLITVVFAAGLAGGGVYGVAWLVGQDDLDVRIDSKGVHVHQRLALSDESSPEVASVPDARPGPWGDGLEGVPEEARLPIAFAYLLYAALCFMEWLVIALSRDYHDQIGRRVALISGVPPEDPEEKPRVRLNLRWLWSKLKRRARGFRVIALGVPVFLVATALPSAWGIVGASVGTLWTGYWLAVFVGAKSALAWHDEKTAGDPWFLRAWSALETRSRLWRWWLPRAYGRLWRRGSRAVFAPCARFEETPWELVGLAFVRLLGSMPVFYLFVRPFLPVAAAHIHFPRAPKPEKD